MAGSRRRAHPRDVRLAGVLAVAIASFWLLALVSVSDVAVQTLRIPALPPDVTGSAGLYLARFTLHVLGGVAAPALPLAVAIVGVGLVAGAPVTRVRNILVGVVLGWPPISALASAGAGGAYGDLVATGLTRVVGRAGAWIAVVAIIIAAAILAGDVLRLGRLAGRLDPVGRRVLTLTSALRLRLVDELATVAGWLAGRRRALAAMREERREARRRAAADALARRRELAAAASRAAATRPIRSVAPEPSAGEAGVDALAGGAAIGERTNGAGTSRSAGTQPEEGTPPDPGAQDPLDDAPPGIVEPEPLPSASDVSPRTPARKVRRDEEVRKRPASEYRPPPVSLLSTPPPSRMRTDRQAILSLSETLRRTLEEFGIRGRISEVHPGPVITRYDFEPAPGVKVNQIVSREDDIALALRTDRVRILTRVPGKAAVGIEIPNDERELIHFTDVMTSPVFTEPLGVLTLALGKDAAGRPFADHLETMPHLLVAGTTGSGKSVCVNTLIASLLFRHRPEDLRLILIDPKMLELTGYNNIPHLALPVVTEPKEATKALNWLVREMERRYRLLSGKGVRNIKSYHERYYENGKPRKARNDEEVPPEWMPYIVCIVDELADLMMTTASEVEAPIARLAQMARAVGIHLVLATQRPSVDVLTGVIKANFPARIAFQVAQRTDSRTILDQNGAESLVGRGDMLYMPSGSSVPLRLHGAFLPDEDIEAICRYLRGFSSSVDPIDIEEKAAAPGEVDDEIDSLFGEAARLVVLQGQASTSFLQRRLKIGYARAGRLMDQLEQAGIVTGYEGSKARDVLVDIDYLEEQGIV